MGGGSVVGLRSQGLARWRPGYNPANVCLTPPAILAAVREAFGVDRLGLEPVYRTRQSDGGPHVSRLPDNGLAYAWVEEPVFVNPPYGAAALDWVRRALEVGQSGRRVALLVPAATEARTGQAAIAGAELVTFLRGRPAFEAKWRPNGQAYALRGGVLLATWGAINLEPLRGVRADPPPRVTPPRIAPPIPRRSRIREFREAAKLSGIRPMPWQLHAARILTGWYRGRWRFPEAALVVARQNGKTTLLVPRIVMGLRAGERIMHTAQNRELPREVFGEVADVLGPRPLEYGIRSIRLANGQEEIRMHNGGRYRIVSPSRAGARGHPSDLVIVDEAREMESFEFVAAAEPTLTTSKHPQVLYLSNAGDEGSVVLNGLRRRAELDPKLAYIEYSAAPERALDDREGWAEANPALGITIREEYLEDQYRKHSLGGTLESSRRSTYAAGSPPPPAHGHGRGLGSGIGGARGPRSSRPRDRVQPGLRAGLGRDRLDAGGWNLRADPPRGRDRRPARYQRARNAPRGTGPRALCRLDRVRTPRPIPTSPATSGSGPARSWGRRSRPRRPGSRRCSRAVACVTRGPRR